jgi:predicted SAM-dependent methyltransferase
LTFPDESISKIYSSHFFEHLSYKEGQTFLGECMRVLVPSGTFSICVPNAKIYIEAYLKYYPLDHFCKYKPAYNNTTKIDYVNYIAYMDGHHEYMFDEENLLFILKKIGIRNVHLREFDPDLDLKERIYESIYVEAER